MRDVDIRPLTREDSPSSLALHRDSFVPYWSDAWWKWRFHSHSNSQCTMVGAFQQDGRCIAMFGGARFPFLLEGELCHVISNGDAAVDPDVRHGLGGPRLLRRVAEVFFHSFERDSTKVIYGFPEPGLRRISVRFRFGEHLGDVHFLLHDLKAPIQASDRVRVTPTRAFDSEADSLWERCKPEFRAAIVRDADYLNYRYRDHPGVDYQLIEARDVSTGALRGLAALRRGGWDDDIASLTEWLVPEEDLETESALLAFAADWARAGKHKSLACWFPAMDTRTRRLQVQHRFYVHPTPYVELFRSRQSGVDRMWLYDNFYQTMGDIDWC